MCLQSSSCHLKLIWGSMMPSCLQKQEHNGSIAVGAEARQLTLEEILYPPPSWELDDAMGATPARRNSPKVCPMNLQEFSDESSSPVVSESVSIVSRAASLRSQNSIARRVSFRSPDESDVFVIPARRDSHDDSSESET